MAKRQIASMCRPPPKPPDRQNSLNDNYWPYHLSKGGFPEIHYTNDKRVNYRSPPKPPYILNVNGKVIGIIEKEDLPYVVPMLKPPPKLPLKVYDIALVPWTR